MLDFSEAVILFIAGGIKKAWLAMKRAMWLQTIFIAIGLIKLMIGIAINATWLIVLGAIWSSSVSWFAYVYWNACLLLIGIVPPVNTTAQEARKLLRPLITFSMTFAFVALCTATGYSFGVGLLISGLVFFALVSMWLEYQGKVYGMLLFVIALFLVVSVITPGSYKTSAKSFFSEWAYVFGIGRPSVSLKTQTAANEMAAQAQANIAKLAAEFELKKATAIKYLYSRVTGPGVCEAAGGAKHNVHQGQRVKVYIGTTSVTTVHNAVLADPKTGAYSIKCELDLMLLGRLGDAETVGGKPVMESFAETITVAAGSVVDVEHLVYLGDSILVKTLDNHVEYISTARTIKASEGFVSFTSTGQGIVRLRGLAKESKVVVNINHTPG